MHFAISPSLAQVMPFQSELHLLKPREMMGMLDEQPYYSSRVAWRARLRPLLATRLL